MKQTVLLAACVCMPVFSLHAQTSIKVGDNVELTQSIEFSIIFNGNVAGSCKQPAGTIAKVEAVEGERIKLIKDKVVAWVNKADGGFIVKARDPVPQTVLNGKTYEVVEGLPNGAFARLFEIKKVRKTKSKTVWNNLSNMGRGAYEEVEEEYFVDEEYRSPEIFFIEDLKAGNHEKWTGDVTDTGKVETKIEGGGLSISYYFQGEKLVRADTTTDPGKLVGFRVLKAMAQK